MADKPKKSLADRIRSTKSMAQLIKLAKEGAGYEFARHALKNKWLRLADQRRAQLAEKRTYIEN